MPELSNAELQNLTDSEVLAYMKNYELQKLKLDEEESRQASLRRKQFFRLVMFSYIAIAFFVGIIYALYLSLGTEQMVGIFKLNEDVLFTLNMSFNAFIYAVPAFAIACLGSITKVLLSPHDLSNTQYLKLIIGSGLIGILTFLGLKSGIVLDLLHGTVELQTLTLADDKKSFYKMIVLCYITGMFATTIFLTVEERVQNLANKIKHS